MTINEFNATVVEADAAIDRALELPIPRPDEAGSHLRAEYAREKAVRAARASFYVAVGARDDAIRAAKAAT